MAITNGKIGCLTNVAEAKINAGTIKLQKVLGRSGRLGASPALINSTLVKRRTNLPPMREGVLVMAVALHPAISVMFFDEFATLQLEHPTLKLLHGAIVDTLAGYDGEGDHMEREVLHDSLCRAGHEEILKTL